MLFIDQGERSVWLILRAVVTGYIDKNNSV